MVIYYPYTIGFRATRVSPTFTSLRLYNIMRITLRGKRIHSHKTLHNTLTTEISPVHDTSLYGSYGCVLKARARRPQVAEGWGP